MTKKDVQIRRNIALSDWYAARASKIGAGSVSRGIRIAIDNHETMRTAIIQALAARNWSKLAAILDGIK